MKNRSKIERSGSFEICRRFHIQIKPVATYMVKRIGVDTQERGSALVVRRGKRLPHSNRRLARLLHQFLLEIRKKRKESKTDHHELIPV
jgi:hypothetical protein